MRKQLVRLVALGCVLLGALVILGAPKAAFSPRLSGWLGESGATGSSAGGIATPEALAPPVGRFHVAMGLVVACGVGFVFFGALIWNGAGRAALPRRRGLLEDAMVALHPTRSGRWISQRQEDRLRRARKQS